MRRRSRITSCGASLLVAVSLAAVSSGSPAQESSSASAEAPRRDGIFTETLEVRLTNVEVYVTHNGLPVNDLVAEDFEVLDDGEPVEITHFYRVEDGRRVGTGADPAGVDDDEPSEAEPGIEEPSTLVILVDQFFLTQRGRKRVFEALSEQLDQLMSGETRVIVASKGLRLNVALASTSDPDEVRKVLEQVAGEVVGNPVGDPSEVVGGIQRIEQTPGVDVEDNVAAAIARSTFDRLLLYTQQVHGQMRSSLDLLETFVRALGGVDGRKAVVYVADQLPIRPAEAEWRYWFDSLGDAFGQEFGVTSAESVVADYDVSGDLESLIAEASTNRVLFYPTGIGRPIGSVFSAAGARQVGRPGQDQEGLRWLAEGTGGRAAVGRFDGDSFFELLNQDLRTYYSLAYPAPHREDGKVHRIEVRVRRDDLGGVQVRYLNRYRDRPADQQSDRVSLAALQFGTGQNPLEVEVRHGEPQKQRGGTYLLPIEVRFPLANLVLLAGRQSHDGRVSFRIAALDDKGRASTPVTLEAPIQIPHEALLEALSRQATFRPQVELREGRQTVSVEVRDEVGAVTSTVLIEVEVGGKG